MVNQIKIIAKRKLRELQNLALAKWKVAPMIWRISTCVAAGVLFLAPFLSAQVVRDIALAFAAIFGFPLLIERTRSLTKQAEARDKQAETDLRRRLAEAFARAAEQFGNTNIAIRLAGINALWALAQEDPKKYHLSIAQLFCHFVCNPPPLDGWRGESVTNKALPGQHPDIRQILYFALSQRNDNQWIEEQKTKFVHDFMGADLRGAYFGPGNLSGVDFRHADLREAKFDKCELDNAIFSFADLRQAKFIDLDLKVANFDEAALNDVFFGDTLKKAEKLVKNGIILTDDMGADLFSGPGPLSQLPNVYSKMKRMRESEWLKKRNKTQGK